MVNFFCRDCVIGLEQCVAYTLADVWSLFEASFLMEMHGLEWEVCGPILAAFNGCARTNAPKFKGQ
jgi:hypothetical protein